MVDGSNFVTVRGEVRANGRVKGTNNMFDVVQTISK